MYEHNSLHVVAAIIVHGDKVLACRRARHKTSAGYWEFPGGKVEPGESPKIALERELVEELNVKCQIFDTFDISETAVDGVVIRLETIFCQVGYPESLSSTDHDAFEWLALSKIKSKDWAKPDLPAVRKLAGLENLRGLINC